MDAVQEKKPGRKVLKPKLSKLQKAWVLAYLADTTRNATEAARVAGYADPTQAGYECRHNPKIQEHIREHFLDRWLMAEEVVAQISEIANVGYAPYLRYDEGKKELFVDLAELIKDGKGHLIKGISYVRTGMDTAVQVVEFFDAYKAKVDVARIHGLFKDNLSVNLDLSRLSDEELDALANAL